MAVISIGSNVLAQGTVRRLADSSAAVGLSFERLSSGMRINRASDDAAGLAIADTLRGRSRVLTTASRNVSDGISLLQITGGALTSQIEVLSRLTELAEQAANGTLSNTQRSALNQEYQTLIAESNRLAESTFFNGLRPLDAAKTNLSSIGIQLGIDGSINSLLQLNPLSTGAFSGRLDVNVPAPGGLVDTESVTFDELSAAHGGQLAYFSVVDDNGQQRDLILTPYFSFNGGGATTTVALRIYQRVSDTGTLGEVSPGGATITDENDDWIFSAAINLQVDAASGEIVSGDEEPGVFTTQINGTIFFDQFSVFAQDARLDLRNLKFSDSSGANFADSRVTSALQFSGVETEARALVALSIARSRLEELSSFSGQLGAVESRLLVAAEQLATSRENILAAEYRIRDTDITSEVALLTASQIRQQVAASLLAQANQQPALALALLEPGN